MLKVSLADVQLEDFLDHRREVRQRPNRPEWWRIGRQIRVELRDAGITESVIYPDLDGLGREMRQRWEDLK